MLKRKEMFENLSEAIRWVRKNYPGCSYSVKEQPDGPTVVSIKHKGTKQLRTVIYARRRETV